MRLVRTLLLLVACGVCQAQGLPADPTKPPGDGVVIGAAASSQGPRLESVVVPVKGKARAVIDGQVVMVGGEIGGRRLVRVAETMVVLEGPEGREKLFLTPEVDKQRSVVKTDKRRIRE